jgi:6-phosphogluconolactonase (cycloisomerase 2 family)
MLLNEKRILAGIVALFGMYPALQAAELSSIETANLRLLYFDPSETFLTPYVVRSFENSIAHQRKTFDYSPSEKITVLLTDFADYGNAGAITVPRNALLVDIAPSPFTYETSDTAERMYSLMNHELVHVVSMDQAAGKDQFYRRLFGGKVDTIDEHPETILYGYLTNPRRHSPRWYMEGMAVFMETWMAGGLGRAQGPYNEMVFRSMVRDDAHFYDPLGLVAEGTAVDFQVGANAYLYGTRFINYLAYTYTPEDLIEWNKRLDGSERSYSDQFRKVYGLPLDQAWQNWIAFEHEFQTANLESVRQFPTTKYQNLSSYAMGSVSRSYLDPDTNKLYAAVRYPGIVAHIAALSLDDGSVARLEDVKGPMLYSVTSLAFDQESKILYYTTDNTDYRDLVALDISTGKSSVLIKDARIGNLVFNPADKSIWGVRHLNGIATLVRIPHPYNEWNQVQSLPYGELYYDLDISPDGRFLSTSFGEIDGDQSVLVLETAALLDGKTEPSMSFELGLSVPESFVFSPDGKYLFGSSFYTGVSNIFRYELATGELEAVSNAETGFFRPIPREDGSLIVFHYTGQGFVPAIIDPVPLEDVGSTTFLGHRVVQKHPQLQNWQVSSPATVKLEDVITEQGVYAPGKNMRFESMYPILEGYKDSVAPGMNWNFSDPIMLNKLKLSTSYSLDDTLASDERVHVSLDYQSIVVSNSPLAGTWKAGARYNYADFYDLFGPTKEALKGNWLYLGYDKTLIYDQPRKLNFHTQLDVFSDLDRLPRYQNVDATIDKLTSFEIGLDYSNAKSSLGHVDDEKGFTWKTIAAADHVDGDTIPKFVGSFDFGFPFLWKHSSIWLRNSAGFAIGEPDDDFANFFFGGFGNNYVDRGEIKRYREGHSMPGFEIDTIPGRNFHRAMLELNLPPVRFERAGTPAFYLSWARPALFVSYLTTNLDDSLVRDQVTNAGLQVDFQFTVLSRLNMTLSLGYAKGFGNSSIMDDDEFMASLKIL